MVTTGWRSITANAGVYFAGRNRGFSLRIIEHISTPVYMEERSDRANGIIYL
jgi:hypothetical protein